MLMNMSPENIFRVLMRRKLVFMLVLAIVVGSALAYCFLATKIYQSDASVLVKIGSQDIANPDLQGSAPMQQTGSDLAKALVNSQISVVESLDVVRAAIEKVGIARLYPKIAATAVNPTIAMGAAIDAIVNRDLDVRVAKESMVLKLFLTNPDPVVAQLGLAAILDAFQRQQAVATREPRLGFLREQLDTLGKQVDIAQSAMLDYKRKTAIGSLEDERLLVLKQRDAQEQSLTAAIAQLGAAKAKEAAATAAMATTSPTIPLANENDASLREHGDAAARLAAATARFQTAQQTYARGNVLLSDAQAQMDLARSDYQRTAGASTSRVRTGVNAVYQTLQTNLLLARADVASYQSQVDQWRAQLTAINQRTDHFNAVEGEMLKLQRQLAVATQDYTAYLARAEAAKISEDLNNASITSLAVIQQPTLPLDPARPKKRLIMALALVAGLVGAAAICFLLEMLDDRVSLIPGLDELMGLPILVALPYVKRPTLRLH